MKKAGFYSTSLGIETASEKILKEIKKGESLDTIQNAITILKKNDITVGGFFILGLPGETKETIKETVDFALHSGLDRVAFAIFNVIPGSDYWNELKGNFRTDFSHDSITDPVWTVPGLSNEYLMKVQSYAVRKFYFRPGIFFNTLRHIKPAYFGTFVKRTILTVGFFHFQKRSKNKMKAPRPEGRGI
jgi:radical SAM superfamily enzyme YgiQ (UPF0313 family)